MSEQEQTPTFPMPDVVERQLKQRQLEYDAEYDRLDKMGRLTTSQIRNQLAKDFPDLLTAEDIEVAEVNEITNNLGSTALRGTGQSHKPTYKPRGPIQRDIADGDKRVEDTYGPPDEQ